MTEFFNNDIVRYQGRLFTIELAQTRTVNREFVDGTYSIVPLNISNAAETDESFEMAQRFMRSTIHDVPGSELELVQRPS